MSKSSLIAEVEKPISPPAALESQRAQRAQRLISLKELGDPNYMNKTDLTW